ncbi:hypothetical protein E2542_SST09870 [Spatholobus suberectus]|nr:hypothetical protein E2542_SST09870 [Spatholobus suberectus]
MSWIDGGGDSMIKWDKVECENRQDYWQWCFLACTRQILLFEQLLSNKCLWEEDPKDEEHGTRRGYAQITNAPSCTGLHSQAVNVISLLHGGFLQMCFI